MEISEIPYKHRSSAADLLISKGNRLTELARFLLEEPPPKKRKAILTGIYFYEIALSLMKPYDPNYSTVLNWKCCALIILGRFNEAVQGYEEIVRISDKTDGMATRNATAELAEEKIKKYNGRDDIIIESDQDEDVTLFDDPPYCMVAQEFCELLAEGKFKKAHINMSNDLKNSLSVAKLKSEWKDLVDNSEEIVDVALENNMTEWQDRKKNEVGWCYFSVSSENINEGIAIVVSITQENFYKISGLEFGRP